MFKSVLSVIAFVALSTSAANAVEFVNQDGSELSNLCIAAVQDGRVNKSQLENLSCNGMPAKTFVKKYRTTKAKTVSQAIRFESKDNTAESELCVAAATSNKAYNQTKNRLFGRTDTRQIACNGKSIAVFAKKYNKAFNG
jgi:esterase/lipase superfamily enzyme